jgi:hypothetical protein
MINLRFPDLSVKRELLEAPYLLFVSLRHCFRSFIHSSDKLLESFSFSKSGVVCLVDYLLIELYE